MILGVSLHTSLCARNNSWPLAIFGPLSTFGQSKSILVSQIYCTFSMGWQLLAYKMSCLQEMTYQFLTLVFTSDPGNEPGYESMCNRELMSDWLFKYIHWPTGH